MPRELNDRSARVLAGLGTAHQAADAFTNDPTATNDEVSAWTRVRNQIEEVLGEARELTGL